MIPPECRRNVAVRDGGERADSSLDSTLEALANERRRRLLYALRENEGVVDEEDLACWLAAEFGTDRDSIHTHLHHTDLPRLAECGLVEYDPDDGSVWYSGGSTVTDLIAAIAEHE